MNIENLLDEITNKYDQDKIDALFNILNEKWLYFYFNGIGKSDTNPGKDNVVKIFTVNSKNPITVPLIINENGSNGVLYTNVDLAIRLAEFDCQIGKMKGKNVFKLFYEMKNIDGVAIQGENSHILASWDNLIRMGNITQ